jgi:hypothetical protein
METHIIITDYGLNYCMSDKNVKTRVQEEGLFERTLSSVNTKEWE